MSYRDEARLLSSAFSGGYGGGYYPGGRSRLVDLLMARGQQQAEATRAQGQMWGDTFKGIGDTIAGGIQQAAEEKKVKARDAAWLEFVNGGEWQNDPRKAYAESLRVWGPEKGPQQFQALAGVSQLMQPHRNAEADGKALMSLGRGADAMTPEGRAAAWPQLRALAHNVYPQMNLPEQYDEGYWTQTLRPAISGMEPPKDGFTLGQGQTRFGPDGKPLASVAPEPPKPPNMQTVETAQGIRPFNPQTGELGPVIAQGRPREPRVDNEPLMAVLDPATGRSVYRRRSQAEGMQPASNREQGRPVVSGDANRIADLDTGIKDAARLRETLAGNKSTGVGAKIGASLPNVVTEFTGWGADAKSKQATIDLVKQIIGKGLEGGVLRKEDEHKYEKILPTIGDPPELVASKLRGLDAVLREKRQTTLDALGDAGYDVDRFAARGGGPHRIQSDAEYDALPSGAVFVGPDGVQRRKP